MQLGRRRVGRVAGRPSPMFAPCRVREGLGNGPAPGEAPIKYGRA